jgi:hypothetical protein
VFCSRVTGSSSTDIRTRVQAPCRCTLAGTLSHCLRECIEMLSTVSCLHACANVGRWAITPSATHHHCSRTWLYIATTLAGSDGIQSDSQLCSNALTRLRQLTVLLLYSQHTAALITRKFKVCVFCVSQLHRGHTWGTTPCHNTVQQLLCCSQRFIDLLRR